MKVRNLPVPIWKRKQYAEKITGKGLTLDLDEEKRLHKTILELIDKQQISSAHDISEGGLAVCLAEKAMISGDLGCEVTTDVTIGKLFGESQSRVVLSCKPENTKYVEKLCKDNNLYCEKLGKVVENSFLIKDYVDTRTDMLFAAYESAIPELMNKPGV